jgi:hypothetical protein
MESNPGDRRIPYESALVISFELKRQKNRPSLWKHEILRRPVVAYGTINFDGGLLRMTYFIPGPHFQN